MTRTEPRKLFKTSIIYAFAQIATQLLNFLLLPVYSNKLGVAEYGKISTIAAFSGFISAFLILSIYSGLCRYYKDVEDKNKLVNSALNFAYVCSAFVIALLLLIGKPLSRLAFDFDEGHKVLWIVALTMIITQITDIYLNKYSMEYKAIKVSYINVGQLLLQFMVIIFLVVNQNMGIMGVLYGQLTGASAVFIYVLFLEFRNFRIEISGAMLKNMLIFSAGLLPVNISGWILTLSDRYFINHYVGLDKTGIYSLGYQFGMLINSLFVSPFLGSFTAYKFEIYKDDDAKEKFKNLFRDYAVLGCFIMLGISIFCKLAITILTNQDFISAYKVVPLVSYSYFLYGMVGYYALGFQIKNQTYRIGIYMFAFAALNISLNFIFVPWLGMMGAALTTMISYFLLNIALMAASTKKYKIDLDLKFQMFIQLIAILLYILYYNTTLHLGNVWMEVPINLGLLAAYIFILYICGFLKKYDLKSLRQAWTTKLSKKSWG